MFTSHLTVSIKTQTSRRQSWLGVLKTWNTLIIHWTVSTKVCQLVTFGWNHKDVLNNMFTWRPFGLRDRNLTYMFLALSTLNYTDIGCCIFLIWHILVFWLTRSNVFWIVLELHTTVSPYCSPPKSLHKTQTIWQGKSCSDLLLRAQESALHSHF